MRIFGAIFGLVGLLITIAIGVWWEMKSLQTSTTTYDSANQSGAIATARALYLQQKSAGVDFSDGPCLSNEIIPGWVADIAHNPRQAVDDLPENQCEAYRDGKAKHFVELDPDGNLIRAQ